MKHFRAERAEKIEQARLQAMQIVEQTRAESNALLEELDKLINRLSAKSAASDEITAVADEEIIENGDDIGEVIFDDSFDKNQDIITNDEK